MYIVNFTYWIKYFNKQIYAEPTVGDCGSTVHPRSEVPGSDRSGFPNFTEKQLEFYEFCIWYEQIQSRKLFSL